MGNIWTETVNWGEVHGIVNSVACFLFANIAVWALHFKSYRYAMFVHIFFMSCAAFIMAFGPLLMIVVIGPSIIFASWYHEFLGFILFLAFPLILLSGAICKISKTQPTVTPNNVYLRNKIHVILGWVILLLMQMLTLTGWYGTDLGTNIIFGVVIFVDVVSYSLFFYLKFLGKRINSLPLVQNVTQAGLRSIKSLKDARVYSQNYFIFANKLYDITPVLGMHPGGWMIIQLIKTREVDRFMYGVDPIEFYDVPRVSHTFNSINLAGQPLAELKIPQTYYGLQEFNQVIISSISCHDVAMKIHMVYLKKVFEPHLNYGGYSDLSQIGRFYALTLNNHKTRLYTAVNFLQPKNISFIMSIAKDQIILNKKYINFTADFDQIEKEMMQQQLRSSLVQQNNQNVLPLLIKKYDDGEFTSVLFNKNRNNIENIIISEQRGFGLSLNYGNSKNIIIFAGGTGLYPYSDLIDLLFKAKLLKEMPHFQKIITQSDPLLKHTPFQGYKFKVYIAINQISELHPITLYQCNSLCEDKKFECFVKAKETNIQKLRTNYPNISTFVGKFENAIEKQLDHEPESQFYICGPVRMTKSLVNELVIRNVPPQNYKIV